MKVGTLYTNGTVLVYLINVKLFIYSGELPYIM